MENPDHKASQLSGYNVSKSVQLKGALDREGKAAKRFSVREMLSKLSLRLAAKGNQWISTFSSVQQRSLVVALLFLLACYFVILSGRSFFAGSSANQSPFPSLPASEGLTPAPTRSPGNNPLKAPQAISPPDSLFFEPADTANSLTP